MDSEDGKVFVKNLAHFIREHEKALANALQGQQSRSRHGSMHLPAGASDAAPSSSPLSISLSMSRPYFSLRTQRIKPSKLSLTPHHLYYLLSTFEDLGVDVGPMKVRLEDMNSTVTPSEYTSFLGRAPRSKGKQTGDADSLRSVSSIRSVMSTVSSLWSNLSLHNTASKVEKQLAQHREDLKYLYSCFTKLPALRFAPDPRLRMISGFEMQPFDIAVPLFAFKNVTSLEICDLDFRLFHGWDRLAANLRSLTVRRSNLDDPLDLLLNIVLDDYSGKRIRSSTSQVPTTPSTPGAPWPLTSSPRLRQAELARSLSTSDSLLNDQRRHSLGTPRSLRLVRGGSADGTRPIIVPPRQSHSPVRPSSSRHGSLNKPRRSANQVHRRSSGSSGSSSLDGTQRHSTLDPYSQICPLQWSFLRHLSLAENGLAFLSATSFAPVADTLQSLDLSGNLLTEIPDLSLLSNLRALNLSNCMIDSLHSLVSTPLPAVTTLNLRGNRLTQLNGVERLPSLERVDFRDNAIRDPTELNRLTGLPNMVDVYVAKNPFTRNNHSGTYRVTIFNLFRSAPGYTEDITIDNFGPLSTEKRYLVDRVPELANVAVVPDTAEEEPEPVRVYPPIKTVDLAHVPLPLVKPDLVPRQHRSHRRATSDIGPDTLRRRKRGTRKRIVDLTPPQTLDDARQASTHEPATETESPTQSIVNEPMTPEAVSIRGSEAAPLVSPSTPPRPTLLAAFTSPTMVPRIHSASDDEDGPAFVSGEPELQSELYRSKVDIIRSDLGTTWLPDLGSDAVATEEHASSRERSFSPHSRTSTIRAGRHGDEVVPLGHS